MYTPREIEGQMYSNRIRANIARIMQGRGIAGGHGLPHLTAAGLYKFLSGRCDITVTRAAQVAEDLGVSLQELMAPTKVD